MCGGGSSGGSTVTQEFKPPKWTTEYMPGTQGPWQSYVAQANTLSKSPYQAYQGQTIADLSPYQQQALDLLQQRAVNGAPDLNAGRLTAMRVAQGDWGANPFLDQNGQYTNQVISDNATNMANAARLGTMAQTDAAFARGGAFGGSAYNQMQAQNASALAQQVGQMANQYQLQRTSLGANDYRGAVDQMLQGAQLGGALSQDDWQAAQALMGGGDVQRAYTQDLLNQGLNNYNQQQLWPYQQLDVLGNALARASGNAAGGSTSTAQQAYQASPYSSLLGAGLGAAGLYSMLSK